jgi:hypothetical protein
MQGIFHASFLLLHFGLGRGADIDSGNTAGFVPFCCNSRSMFRQLLGSLQDLIHPNAIRGRHIIET